MSETVLVERDEGVATVTLNRPERMNALTDELMRALAARLRELADDAEVRCVVLTGAGERAFSAGADLQDVPSDGTPGADGPETLEESIDRLQAYQESSWLLHTMRKPTLAAVNGACAGASLSMAAACDLRFAAENAVFRTAFSGIGFSGDYGGSYFLTHILGTAKARELYLLGDKIDAVEAERIGLVSKVFPREGFRKELDGLAKRLAAGPPVAYRYMKRNLNHALQLHLRDLLDLEAEAMMRTGRTEDFREAVQAFLKKETPSFRGR